MVNAGIWKYILQGGCWHCRHSELSQLNSVSILKKMSVTKKQAFEGRDGLFKLFGYIKTRMCNQNRGSE